MKSFQDECEGNPAVDSIREPSQWNAQVCSSCAPVLEKYSVTFNGMKRQRERLEEVQESQPAS